MDYQTAAQCRNVPIMIGIDSIQKVYGSNNNLVPSAITTLVRNVGLAFCQSATLVKVCILKMKLLIITTIQYFYLYTIIVFFFLHRNY